jgi:broad-specificity NMP kinase/uncharacterized protein (UPF0218 family)
MIVAITGTPGTGKTEAAKALAKRMRWKWFSLNSIAESKGLYEGYDKERMSKIVDIRRLREEVNELATENDNMIIEAHYAHDMPCDVVIVLRTNPDVLRKRMVKKSFHTEKVAENLEAEMMQVILDEAQETRKSVYEIDTTRKTPEKAAREIEKIIRNQTAYIEKDLVVPEQFIMDFRRPFGKLYSSGQDDAAKRIIKELKKTKGLTVTVGDMTSHSLIKNGLKPNMIIIDGKQKRGRFEGKISFNGAEVKVKNPARHITVEMWKAIETSIPGLKKRRVKILVNGEEDLAVLPCAIHLPLGSRIIYGQFGEGLVLVYLDQERKDRAKAILENIMFSQ